MPTEIIYPTKSTRSIFRVEKYIAFAMSEVSRIIKRSVYLFMDRLVRWDARVTGLFWILALRNVESFPEGSLRVVAWRKSYAAGQIALI